MAPILVDGHCGQALSCGQGVQRMRCGLRLLLGQRGEEVSGMKRSEIDLNGTIWDLPGSRTKNGRTHSGSPHGSSSYAAKATPHRGSPDEPRVFPGLTRWHDDAGSAPSGGVVQFLTSPIVGYGPCSFFVDAPGNHSGVSPLWRSKCITTSRS